MAGFDDLVHEAMPYLAKEEIAGSAGSTWEWTYGLIDASGVAVDFGGCTAICELRTKFGAAVALAPTVTFPGDGVVKCVATPSQTAALPAGRYLHELEITDAAGRKVKVVGSGDSYFVVKGEVTT